jgi:hypothetical protein
MSSLPWLAAPAPPWTTQQGIYNRTIEIRRRKNVSGETPAIGLTGYSGTEQTTNSGDNQGEVSLFSGIACTIQAKTPGRSRSTELPSDFVEKPFWTINVPANLLAQYSIRDRDLVYDDEGYRYGVVMNTWTTLGYQLVCMRLEA